MGGSGVTAATVLADRESRTVTTPYGEVRAEVGVLGEAEVVFLARHGRGHRVPPHRVNYRALVRALGDLGVERVVATAAVGALHEDLTTGTAVIIDQFLDFTRGRPATFHDGGAEGVVHVDVTRPYCPQLGDALERAAGEASMPVRRGGTYVCTEGPRFETAAEVRAFRMLGGDVVGMTGVPEVVLARELGLCYATLATVTNPAAGLVPDPVSHEEVLAAQAAGVDRLRAALAAVPATLPPTRTCACPDRPEPVHRSAAVEPAEGNPG